MIVRALVAVMTLVGAVPFRVCTCGAAHHYHHADAPPPAPQPQPEGVAHQQSAALSPNERPPHYHHDPDCHAVKPRPAMSLAVPAALVEMPDADFTGTATVEPPQPLIAPGHAATAARPPPRARPLFLTLQVFRN